MKLNHSKIQEVINELCLMKVKLANLDTMFIAYRLDKALKDIGNDYAELCLAEQKEVKNDQN
jgi:hypothetical protein